MKKERKSLNKKLLILSLVLLSLITVSVVMVAAADEVDPNISFFQRWVQSQLTNVDAKVILFIMVAVILYVLFFSLTDKGGMSLLLSLPITFVLTVYVTPNEILGIIRSYNTLPLMITSILPLIVLGAFTFLAIEKDKKSLIMGQHAAWWLYFTYLIFRLAALAYAWSYVDTIATSTDLFDIAMNSFANLPPPEQATTFWIAFAMQFVIAGIMSFKNGMIMRTVGKSVQATQQAQAERSADEIVAAAKNLKKIEKGLESA